MTDKSQLIEAWILDTGKILIESNLHPSWKSNRHWLNHIRSRTVCRVWIEPDQMEAFTRLEQAFDGTRLMLELCDGLGDPDEKRDGKVIRGYGLARGLANLFARKRSLCPISAKPTAGYV